MSVTIAIMSYSELTEVINRLGFVPPSEVEIIIVNSVFEDTITIAKEMEESQKVDVFVSAGANGYLLAQNIKTPLVNIKTTGFDILMVLTKLSNVQPVAIITYKERIQNFEHILPLINMEVQQYVYNSIEELNTLLVDLVSRGIYQVIGSSLVCELARTKKMEAVFICSEEGIQRALEAAIDIGLAKQAEAEKAKALETILDFTYEGIIATDSKGNITVFNPSAQRITNISDAIGKNITEILPSTRLHCVIAQKSPELNQIQSIGENKILTNRVPLFVKGQVTGAVATFQDITAVQRAEEKIRKDLHQKGFVAKSTFNNILGNSEAICEARNQAKMYACTDSTVLILGQTGTGKERFAQAIHNASQRAKRPFVGINCAALPAALLESELFGHEEGAFTGSKKGGKPGMFELAHSGTIFLDEIGEVSLSVQARLLRVLEEREVLRVGGEHIIPVNIRVIAATNKDLWQLVRSGHFREDLYYRLCVLEIRLPRLCEQQGDIPLLAHEFFKLYQHCIDDALVAEIVNHPYFNCYEWPGNIRELRNVVERIAVLYRPRVSLDKLMQIIFREKMTPADTEINKVLAETGNKTKTAQKLGMSRTTLWRKLKQQT